MHLPIALRHSTSGKPPPLLFDSGICTCRARTCRNMSIVAFILWHAFGVAVHETFIGHAAEPSWQGKNSTQWPPHSCTRRLGQEVLHARLRAFRCLTGTQRAFHALTMVQQVSFRARAGKPCKHGSARMNSHSPCSLFDLICTIVLRQTLVNCSSTVATVLGVVASSQSAESQYPTA